jgi:hypothetical protein
VSEPSIEILTEFPESPFMFEAERSYEPFAWLDTSTEPHTVKVYVWCRVGPLMCAVLTDSLPQGSVS